MQLYREEHPLSPASEPPSSHLQVNPDGSPSTMDGIYDEDLLGLIAALNVLETEQPFSEETRLLREIVEQQKAAAIAAATASHTTPGQDHIQIQPQEAGGQPVPNMAFPPQTPVSHEQMQPNNVLVQQTQNQPNGASAFTPLYPNNGGAAQPQFYTQPTQSQAPPQFAPVSQHQQYMNPSNEINSQPPPALSISTSGPAVTGTPLTLLHLSSPSPVAASSSVASSIPSSVAMTPVSSTRTVASASIPATSGVIANPQQVQLAQAQAQLAQGQIPSSLRTFCLELESELHTARTALSNLLTLTTRAKHTIEVYIAREHQQQQQQTGFANFAERERERELYVISQTQKYAEAISEFENILSTSGLLSSFLLPTSVSHLLPSLSPYLLNYIKENAYILEALKKALFSFLTLLHSEHKNPLSELVSNLTDTIEKSGILKKNLPSLDEVLKLQSNQFNNGGNQLTLNITQPQTPQHHLSSSSSGHAGFGSTHATSTHSQVSIPAVEDGIYYVNPSVSMSAPSITRTIQPMHPNVASSVNPLQPYVVSNPHTSSTFITPLHSP